MITAVKQQLEESKAQLNARKAELSLATAFGLTIHSDAETRAIAHHRAAMAYKMLGLTRLAKEHFELAYKAFREVDDSYRRAIGQAIVVRDQQLFKLLDVYTTTDQPKRMVALRRMRRVRSELESLPQTREVMLELVVTEAFINRAEIIIDGPTFRRCERLHSDCEMIRKLRGNSDAIYELDALGWLLDRGEFPPVPNALVVRAFTLALEVHNPLLVTKYAALPVFNSAQWAFQRLFA